MLWNLESLLAGKASGQKSHGSGREGMSRAPRGRSELSNMWVALRLTHMLTAVTFLCFRMMELPKGQH